MLNQLIKMVHEASNRPSTRVTQPTSWEPPKWLHEGHILPHVTNAGTKYVGYALLCPGTFESISLGRKECVRMNCTLDPEHDIFKGKSSYYDALQSYVDKFRLFVDAHLGTTVNDVILERWDSDYRTKKKAPHLKFWRGDSGGYVECHAPDIGDVIIPVCSTIKTVDGKLLFELGPDIIVL